MKNKRLTDRGYFDRLTGSISRVINVLIFNGHPSESLSARSYRYTLERPSRKTPRIIRSIIDTIYWFDENHTMKAYFADLEYARQRLESFHCNT